MLSVILDIARKDKVINPEIIAEVNGWDIEKTRLNINYLKEMGFLEDVGLSSNKENKCNGCTKCSNGLINL